MMMVMVSIHIITSSSFEWYVTWCKLIYPTLSKYLLSKQIFAIAKQSDVELITPAIGLIRLTGSDRLIFQQCPLEHILPQFMLATFSVGGLLSGLFNVFTLVDELFLTDRALSWGTSHIVDDLVVNQMRLEGKPTTASFAFVTLQIEAIVFLGTK